MRKFLFTAKIIWAADKGYILWILLSFLLQAPSTIMSTFFFALLITGAEDGSLGIILFAIITYAVSAILLSITSCYMAYKRLPSARMKIERHLNHLLLKKVSKLDMEFFDNPDSYDSLTKAVMTMEMQIAELLGTVSSFMSLALSMAVGLLTIIMLEPFFIIIAVIMGIISLAGSIWTARRMEIYNEEIAPVTRRAQYFKGLFFLRNTISDFKQFVPFSGLLFNKYDDALKEKQNLEGKLNSSLFKVQTVHSLFADILTTLIPYLYLGFLLYSGTISVAATTALIASFLLVTGSFANAAEFAGNLKQNSLFVKYLMYIFDYKLTIDIAGGIVLTDIESIRFDDVSFKYPNTDEYALQHLTFSINKGDKIALVGENGAGKTSIVRLLVRFYDPQGGHIIINGRDIKEYDIISLRVAISSVFQDFVEYALPIEEIISCNAGLDVDKSKIENVLKQVGLFEKVIESKNGTLTEYTKYFEEDGLVFSGGQLQKLIIARMLYKNAQVIIMDEASSSLDPKSEYEINKQITEIAESRTLIVISHRLSSVISMDKIIFLENGRVTEEGNHAQLIDNEGSYCTLFKLQASGYIDER